MYCSTCGNGLIPGQPVCPRCGHPVTIAPPPNVPAFQFELANYASRMRALSTVWYIWGGLSLVLGFMGMIWAKSFLHGPFIPGPWGHGPWPPFWFMPAIIRLGWMYVIARSGLAILAGYGLMERAPWGRIVAIIAAFVNIIKIPFGTALAIWTLVMLMGYRSSTLYDQLTHPYIPPAPPVPPPVA